MAEAETAAAGAAGAAGVQGAISKALDLLVDAKAVVLAAIGLGCTRALLGWILTLSRVYSKTVDFAVPPQYYVGVGSLVGFFAVAWLAGRTAPMKDCPHVLGAGLLSAALGSLLVFAASLADGVAGTVAGPTGVAIVQAALFAAGAAFVAGGYAVLMLLQLELLGTMAPRKALEAFALAYLVNCAIWFAFQRDLQSSDPLPCMLLALVSAFLLVASYRGVPAWQLPSRTLPRGTVSGKLVLWVAVFSLALGIGDSFTHLAYTTEFSKLGMALPEIIVLLCLWLAPGHFEIGTFYRMTFVLMLLGLTGVFFTSLPFGMSQVVISASTESQWLFSLMVALFVAHQRQATSAAYCGALLGSMTLATRVGYLAGTALDEQAEMLYVGTLVLVAVFGTILLRENRFDRDLHLDTQSESNEASLITLAGERGLSAREQSVYLLLARGHSYEDIGKALFIAPSTVRAHTSRIYEKFGVHTRQEFDQHLRDQLSGGGRLGI